MSLNWDWSDKMGEATYIGLNGKEYTSSIYKGNAYMIWVLEYTGDDGVEKYGLEAFFNDNKHLSECLKNGCLRDSLKKLRLDLCYKSTPDIVSAFAKAKFPITIELYEGKF